MVGARIMISTIDRHESPALVLAQARNANPACNPAWDPTIMHGVPVWVPQLGILFSCMAALAT